MHKVAKWMKIYLNFIIYIGNSEESKTDINNGPAFVYSVIYDSDNIITFYCAVFFTVYEIRATTI